MKKILFMTFIVASIVAGSLSFGWAADIKKIGVIDFQKILNTSIMGKRTSDELNASAVELKKKLDKAKADIEAMSKTLEKEALVLSDEKREERQREFRIKFNDFQIMKQDYSNKIRNLKTKLIRKIEQDVFELAKTIGEKEGYTLILEKRTSGIIFMPEQIDITDRLIKQYNATPGKTK